LKLLLVLVCIASLAANSKPEVAPKAVQTRLQAVFMHQIGL